MIVFSLSIVVLFLIAIIILIIVLNLILDDSSPHSHSCSPQLIILIFFFLILILVHRCHWVVVSGEQPLKSVILRLIAGFCNLAPSYLLIHSLLPPISTILHDKILLNINLVTSNLNY